MRSLVAARVLSRAGWGCRPTPSEARRARFKPVVCKGQSSFSPRRPRFARALVRCALPPARLRPAPACFSAGRSAPLLAIARRRPHCQNPQRSPNVIARSKTQLHAPLPYFMSSQPARSRQEPRSLTTGHCTTPRNRIHPKNPYSQAPHIGRTLKNENGLDISDVEAVICSAHPGKGIQCIVPHQPKHHQSHPQAEHQLAYFLSWHEICSRGGARTSILTLYD